MISKLLEPVFTITKRLSSQDSEAALITKKERKDKTLKLYDPLWLRMNLKLPELTVVLDLTLLLAQIIGFKGAFRQFAMDQMGKR